MPLGDILGILSSAMSALNVVVVVGGGRRGQIGNLTSPCLNCLHLPHGLHGVLEFLVLNLPNCLLFFSEGFEFGSLHFLFYFGRLFLRGVGFAYPLMLADSVCGEGPFAPPAGDEVGIGLSVIHGHLLLEIVTPAHRFDFLLGLGVFAERTFVLEVLFEHRLGFAGFLVRDQ